MPRTDPPAVSLLVLALCGGLFAAGESHAQAPSPTERIDPFESIDVEVVNVEVLALDSDGRAVRDLARDDFELLVDGKPAAIGYFSGPGETAGGPASEGNEAGAGAVAPAPAGTVALFVDLEDLRPGPRNEVLQRIRPLLAERIAAGDHVLIAAYQGSLRLLGGISAEAASVEQALTALEKSAAHLAPERMQRMQLVREIELSGRDDPDLVGEANRIHGELMSLAAIESMRHQRILGAMADLLGMLAGVDGPKLVLWVGESLPEQPIASLAARFERRFSREFSTEVRSIDTGPEVRALRRARERVARAAQSSRSTLLVIDAVDPFGSELPADSGSDWQPEVGSAAIASVDEAMSSLAGIAERSGGRRLPANAGLREALGRISGELGGRYSLGFSPPGETDRGWHRIALACRRPGIRLRHREGFLRRNATEQLTEAVLTAASFGSPAENALGLSFAVGAVKPPASKGGGHRVPLLLKIPLSRLLLIPEGDHHSGRLALQFATRDAGGRLTSFEPRQLPLTIPNAKLAASLRQNLGYEIELPLPPGEHRIAVGLQDELAGVRAAATGEVNVLEAP